MNKDILNSSFQSIEMEKGREREREMFLRRYSVE